MINKLIAIKNVGKFSKLDLRYSDWNGVFAKTTIIYAPNGSGKTTLSTIFQSLKNDSVLLKKRATFETLRSDDSPEQHVSLLVANKPIEYRNGVWNQHLEEIEVFNIHFIEDNLFTGSRQLRHNQHNLFSVLSGAEGEAKRTELASLRRDLAGLIKQERRVKNRARKGLLDQKTKNDEVDKIRALREPLSESIRTKDREIGLYVQDIFGKFVERTNGFLSRFSNSLRLEKISKELDQRTTFYLQFGPNRVTFESREQGHEFRYTLSEGDKNALSLSVFLAKLSFIPNPENWIVVFDDPLTSLDSSRRYLTVKQLAKTAEMVGQLLVLTHDAGFAADLEREVRGAKLSLELIASQAGSQFALREHQKQNVTGLFRDIETLVAFQAGGATDEAQRREVVRCLRPILEGIVRIKYFDRLGKKEWLGDFIEAVRAASPTDELHRLKMSGTLDQLCDVNDYSKGFHHSSPGEPRDFIDEQELCTMVNMTLSVLKAI